MKQIIKRIAIFITILGGLGYSIYTTANIFLLNSHDKMISYFDGIKGIGDVLSLRVVESFTSSGLMIVNQNVIIGFVFIIILLCGLLSYYIFKLSSTLKEIKDDTDVIQDNQEISYEKISHIEEVMDEGVLDRKDV